MVEDRELRRIILEMLEETGKNRIMRLTKETEQRKKDARRKEESKNQTAIVQKIKRQYWIKREKRKFKH